MAATGIRMILEFLLAGIFLHAAFTFELPVTTSRYVRSHDSSAYVGSVLHNMVAMSTSHCAAMCSQSDRCHVINICPLGVDGSLRQVFCSLLGNGNLQATNDTQQNCFQMLKMQPENNETTGKTTALCENGGIFENGQCQCPIQYSGARCQRLIRDCSEAYENGHRLDGQGITLLIQPVGSVSPFWIICRYPDLGYPFVRSSMRVSFIVDWQTAKTWIGDNTSSINFGSSYFIGLENLHQLLSQADYTASVHCVYNNYRGQGWVYYENFAVGPETSSYSLSYKSTYKPTDSAENPLDDGFTALTPLAFSTKDHNPDNCMQGKPGWFPSDCTGYSPFADKVFWPANGKNAIVDTVHIAVSRSSKFNTD